MTNYQKILIDGKQFYIIDSIQDFRIEDSFVHRKNKLTDFGGNGEARKYVGSYSNEINRKRLNNFWGYNNWGEPDFRYSIIQENCFFSKSNLEAYLNDAREEFLNQSQSYHSDISEHFDSLKKEVESLNNLNFFKIEDYSDLKNSRGRAYIKYAQHHGNEKDKILWDLFRRLILPKITYISVLKISSDKNGSNPKYYFRILIDFEYRSIAWQEDVGKVSSNTVPAGSDPYRPRTWKIDVHNFMNECPFTKISDTKILIASHIKTVKQCKKEENVKHAIDKLNGITLSPTYDRLFDQGYITFTDEGELICGTLLTKDSWEKLNINPLERKKYEIFPVGREEYLEWHRKNIFRH